MARTTKCSGERNDGRADDDEGQCLSRSFCSVVIMHAFAQIDVVTRMIRIRF